jgi:hypothetical protein
LLNQPGQVNADELHQFLPAQMPIAESLAAPFTELEIYRAFNTMNNARAPGEDQRPIDVENYAQREEL